MGIKLNSNAKIAGSVFGKKSVTQSLHDSGILLQVHIWEDAIKKV